MPPFFSGTDNNDDKNHVMYSGVFGNLDRSTPSTVWRANYNGTNSKVDVSEIFAVPMPESEETPADWLEKVTEKKYTTTVGKGRYSGRHRNNRNSSSTPTSQTSNWSNTKTTGRRPPKSSPSQTTSSSKPNGTPSKNVTGLPKPNSTQQSTTQNSGQDSSSSLGEEGYYFDPDTYEIVQINTNLGVTKSELPMIGPEDIDMSDIFDLSRSEFDSFAVLYDDTEMALLYQATRLQALEDGVERSSPTLGYFESTLGLDFDDDDEEDGEGTGNNLKTPKNESPEECSKQALLWYKGLEDNPEAQVSLLRSLFEASDDDAKLSINQSGM